MKVISRELNSKRGDIVHSAVVHLINDATEEKIISLAKQYYLHPHLFTGGQVRQSLPRDYIETLIKKYTKFYVFISYVAQGYCLARSGVAEWGDPELHGKYKESISNMAKMLQDD